MSCNQLVRIISVSLERGTFAKDISWDLVGVDEFGQVWCKICSRQVSIRTRVLDLTLKL